MGVAPDVRQMAASYAKIRGLVAWASLAQGVCLSAILATRDAVTPLKVVCTAAATRQKKGGTAWRTNWEKYGKNRYTQKTQKIWCQHDEIGGCVFDEGHCSYTVLIGLHLGTYI